MEQHRGGQGLRVKRQSRAPGDERSEGVEGGDGCEDGFQKTGRESQERGKVS